MTRLEAQLKEIVEEPTRLGPMKLYHSPVPPVGSAHGGLFFGSQLSATRADVAEILDGIFRGNSGSTQRLPPV